MLKTSVGIIFICIVGQSIYASQEVKDTGKDKKFTRKYSSQIRRERRIKSIIHKDLKIIKDRNITESDYAGQPGRLIHYKLGKALDGKEIPLESPELAEQIHGLKKLHAYTSVGSNSSVGTKIAPMELESHPSESHEGRDDTAFPSCCSSCVIL